MTRKFTKFVDLLPGIPEADPFIRMTTRSWDSPKHGSAVDFTLSLFDGRDSATFEYSCYNEKEKRSVLAGVATLIKNLQRAQEYINSVSFGDNNG